MKYIYFIVFFVLQTQTVKSECNLNKPNDILELIKANHPNISFNASKEKSYHDLIKVAEQRPNPQLDIQTNRGDSFEGRVHTTSVSLKHTFETGGKRELRIRAAQNAISSKVAIIKYQDQSAIIESVLMLHRLRQVYELIPLYKESLNAFGNILKSIRGRKSLSPEQQVEGETLELVVNDYKLKITQLNSDKIRLSKHLRFFTGTKCEISQNTLPMMINLNENFDQDFVTDQYNKLKGATSELKLAQANLELQKSIKYPNIQIGPTYQYQRLDARGYSVVGISLTMDLPLLNTNRGMRSQAVSEVAAAARNLSNIKNESILDAEIWISKYIQFRDSLKTIANKEKLDSKHKKIESLFKRGIISTTLVIESHRQLIEFFNTRFEFENGAIEALWNIYKLNGKINDQILL